MQAVIMAAGLGTRLRPHTLTVPKPMLPVAGRPILEWSLESLPPETDEIVLVVGYLKERIMERFGREWRGRPVTYVEQRELKGTGDALAICAPLLKDRFVVMNGDDLYSAADISSALRHDLAVLAKKTDVPGRFGALKTDANGDLTEIVEAGALEGGGLVNIGVYVLDRRFFEYPLVPIKDGAEFGLPQTIVNMAKDHPVKVCPASFWFPIGYPEDLGKATEILNGTMINKDLKI